MRKIECEKYSKIKKIVKTVSIFATLVTSHLQSQIGFNTDASEFSIHFFNYPWYYAQEFQQTFREVVFFPRVVQKYTKFAVPGHFAERHFAERHFAERTFCRRTLSRTDILSNGQYDERTFRRKDILPKRQLAENREILGIVTHFSKMCNFQSLCNYKITIVRSLPYMTVHNGH